MISEEKVMATGYILWGITMLIGISILGAMVAILWLIWLLTIV